MEVPHAAYEDRKTYSSFFYLDHNIYTSASNQRDPLYKDANKILALLIENDCALLWSDVHKREARLGDFPEQYVKTLETHSAFYLCMDANNLLKANSSGLPLQCGVESSITSDDIAFDHVWDALENALIYPQHMFGGRKDVPCEELTQILHSNILRGIQKLESHIDPQDVSAFRKVLAPNIEKLKRILSDLSPREEFEKSQIELYSYREASGNFGKLQNLKPKEAAIMALNLLPKNQREALIEKHAEGKAKSEGISVGEICGFAFTLFNLGIGRKRDAFSGKRQEEKYKAQFRDCMHIGFSASAQAFVTMDKGAADLASATLSYLGFDTKVIHIKVNNV